ncbi:MAG: winged helix-turn-helix domain-containing tetratricopeptide repeat protein [Hyphomicrobiaceae bacterium]
MLLSFNAFLIDEKNYTLCCEGEECNVEPLVFDLILFLARNPQRLVSRDELIENVWSNRIVSDATISSCIKAARQVLGDNGNEQRVIRTIRSRGIQFLADVTAIENLPEKVSPEPAQSGPVTQSLEGADTGHLGRLSEFDRDGCRADALGDFKLPERPSIAVMPFETLDQAIDHIVFSDGLTHDIISRISRLRWLFVIARGSTFTFRNTTERTDQIARALGVRYVANGTVRFAGNRVRVNAFLVDAISGHEIWADRFDRQIDDIFAIQDEISSAIVSYLEVEIEEAEQKRALHSPPETLGAWSNYHRGIWHMHRFSKDNFAQAEHFFQRSCEIDPDSPRSFAGLSFVNFQRHFLGLVPDREEALDRAFELAEHSIELDPKDPLGHMALGRALLMRREYDHSIDELETSIRLNPNLAPAQFSLSRTLMAAGISERGIEAADIARRLSPNDPMRFAMLSVRANCLAQMGEFEEAVKWVQQATHQSNAHFHILAIAVYITCAADEMDLARKYKDRLLRNRPDYRISDFFRGFPLRSKEHIALVVDGLRKAGLPE